jgi:uncharacterized protein YbbK (DUF523 family)
MDEDEETTISQPQQALGLPVPRPQSDIPFSSDSFAIHEMHGYLELGGHPTECVRSA